MTHFGPGLQRLACIASFIALTACGGGGSDTSTATNSGNGGSAGSGSTGTTTTTPAALGATRSGEGTYYGATGEGACSFDASSNRMVAAMNHTDYAGSAACGEYVTVTGPKGTITVRITDECPECAAGDIDLSGEAFALIADRWPVACPSPGRSWQPS
jgi:expansin (peptidoglycan-binding protein)